MDINRKSGVLDFWRKPEQDFLINLICTFGGSSGVLRLRFKFNANHFPCNSFPAKLLYKRRIRSWNRGDIRPNLMYPYAAVKTHTRLCSGSLFSSLQWANRGMRCLPPMLLSPLITLENVNTKRVPELLSLIQRHETHCGVGRRWYFSTPTRYSLIHDLGLPMFHVCLPLCRSLHRHSTF